jgi:hypothetical protein
MPVTQQPKQHEDPEQHKRAMLNALIGEQVIHVLGQPDNLLQMQVRLLWQNHYRVNVLIGADAASARIANSYFVKSDSDGNIVESTPKISKQY